MWARKYRPKTFEEVVGQDHAVATLKESVDRANTFILSGPSGVGKAQPLTSKILTPDGYIAMRDVSVGNKVIDGDGFITTVIGVYPQGTRDIYKITLNDRTSYEVSDEHLNVVEYRNPDNGLMVKEVLTTAELIEAMKHKRRVYRIPVPVLNSWEERAVPIDPYLLGALIGDGSLANNQKFSNSEPDVIAKVKQKLEEIGHTLTWTSRYDYAFSRTNSSFPYLVHLIRHMGLDVKSSQKHIPKEYLYNSYNVRLRLFQGLFDTDGTIEHGVPTFNTSSQQLSEDMTFLARSLGMCVTVSCSMGAYTQNGIKIKTIPSYQLTMKINNGVQFYTSLKHSSRYKRRQTDVIRKIVSVEFVGKKECQCVMVESGAHTYITDNVTVTHNTTLARIYGEHIDSEIIEINGADNNGVDDVRGLTTMAVYSPSFNKHRMFIIDEAHMLTTQAWNALLKVLEESPKSTVWVICTTEPSKIPATIHSRAVTIRLKRVKSSVIRQLIETIIKREGLDGTVYDSQIMSDIITKSNGRVREALTAAETYITTGVEPNGMTTLDVIRYITNVYNANIEVVNKYHENLDNEDVKAVANFITNYISFLLLNSRLRGSMPVQSILATYTTIDPFYLDDLRVMQTAIYTASKTSKEPVSDTIATLYNYYDRILSHYNDFRDTTESFKIATLTYMAELDNRG